MKYCAILTLCFFAFAATAASRTDPLGSHDVGGHGCVLCHVPSTTSESGVSERLEGVFWSRQSGTPEGILGPATINAQHPLYHTFICLTCHDGSLANLALMGRRLDPDANVLPRPGTELVRASHDHPVHVPYLPNEGCDIPSATCNPDHWPSRVDSSGALTWVGDTVSETFDATYGRPARFYPTSEGGGMAMVECTTCHNPHSMQTARLKLAGTIQDKPSQAFVRGWYEKQGRHRDTISQFCRSCHYGQAGDPVNVGQPLK